MHPREFKTQHVALAHATDLDGWRSAARSLLARDLKPEMIEWTAGSEVPGLFATDCAATSFAVESTYQMRVPREFVTLCSTVILHSDPDRFALLYRLLWRLRGERELLRVAFDADVSHADLLANAVRRDMHKMKAFVRFKEIFDDGPLYLAWFEPAHNIVEATAPFFARRFATRRWSILTPKSAAHWDGDALTFGPGARREDVPTSDRLEDLWRGYYASIFNPARLKVKAMQSQMPRKYWHNLPEANLIAPLIESAHRRTQEMIERSPVPSRARRAVMPPTGSRATAAHQSPLGVMQNAAANCRDCGLWKTATQTVFGEGQPYSPIMLVGEQPGDQEDLVGRPFVGPSGKLLNRALETAGIFRHQIYVTNAVKHFKFEPRGKRRLHKKPADAEIAACYQWLEREVELVKPALIVAMGATAAYALLGSSTPVQATRGKLFEYGEGLKVLITVHPSFLLRIPEISKPREFNRFVADLKFARSNVVVPPSD